MPSSELECRAEEWIKGIQEESGLLVEQGFDPDSNPVIGFSHLTFQEYLAATAINDHSAYQLLLANHLLVPAWREVVLLSVALAPDATETIERLLHAPIQPDGVMLAGLCLAEKVKHVKSEIQQEVLEKIKMGFEQADEMNVKTFGHVLAAMGGSEVTTFVRGQLVAPMQSKRLEAINVLGQLNLNDAHLTEVQSDLVNVLETPNDAAIMIAAREALAQVGDPRFTGTPPLLFRFHSRHVAFYPLQTCGKRCSFPLNGLVQEDGGIDFLCFPVFLITGVSRNFILSVNNIPRSMLLPLASIW